MLPAYLDKALAPEAMDKVRERLATDPTLRAAYEELLSQESALRGLGAVLRDAAPTVDIEDAVMARVSPARSETRALKASLRELGVALYADAPRVDIVGDVMATYPARSEEAALAALEGDMIAVGDGLRTLAPRVDIVEPVMRDVASGRLDKDTSLAAARKRATRRRESLFSWRFVAAAAACVLAVLSVFVMRLSQPPVPNELHLAGRTPATTERTHQHPDHEPPSLLEGEPLATSPSNAGERLSLLTSATRPVSGTEPEESAEFARPSRAFTAQDIIAAKRDAIGGESEALALLARWGALDPDEVRRLLEEGLLSPAELAGLSRFLPDAEAYALLKEALEQSPDNPALHYALARNLMLDPNRYEEALQQLALFKEIASDNSLPYYMDARIRLAQGDYAGALEALEYAGAFQAGSAFALDNARQHSLALQAAGMSFDEAQLLAAFNAGAEEYNATTQLGYELLSYGAYFESVGDAETALAIYKSVHQMGLQLNQGAAFSNEMLAGLDVQMAAIEAMNGLAQVMDIPGGAYTLEIAYVAFVEGLDFFLEHTEVFDNMIAVSDMSTIFNAVRYMMHQGDLDYQKGP